jgi:hypothetical protein
MHCGLGSAPPRVKANPRSDGGIGGLVVPRM